MLDMRTNLRVILLTLSIIYSNAFALNPFELKAIFIFKFTSFVEWPKEKLPPQGDLKILFIGKRLAFETHRDIASKLDDKKGLSVDLYEAGKSDVSNYHIVILGEEVPKEATQKVQKRNDLLVISFTGAHESSMIDLKLKNNKIVFDINKVNVKKSDLRISSKFLRLADNN